MQRYKEAIECFDRAINIDKGFADAWHNKGVSLGNSGNYEKSDNYRESIECFDTAINILENSRNGKRIDLDIDQDLADVLRKEGFAYGRIGEHDKAKDCFDRAVLIYEQIRPFDKAIDTDFAYALNSKGYYLITYSSQKYHKEAIECFDKAIKIRPDFAYPYYNKSFVLSKLGKYDQASEYLDKAIKVDPDLAHAWNNKGYALNSLGKYGEAVKCFDNAINLFYRNMKKENDDPNYSNFSLCME